MQMDSRITIMEKSEEKVKKNVRTSMFSIWKINDRGVQCKGIFWNRLECFWCSLICYKVKKMHYILLLEAKSRSNINYLHGNKEKFLSSQITRNLEVEIFQSKLIYWLNNIVNSSVLFSFYHIHLLVYHQKNEITLMNWKQSRFTFWS